MTVSIDLNYSTLNFQITILSSIIIHITYIEIILKYERTFQCFLSTEKDDLTVSGSSKHRKRKSLSDPLPTSGKALTLDLTTTENVSRFSCTLFTVCTPKMYDKSTIIGNFLKKHFPFYRYLLGCIK